jgi:hypothetical protein
MFEACHAIALGLDKRTILDDTDCDARQMLSLHLIPHESVDAVARRLLSHRESRRR